MIFGEERGLSGASRKEKISKSARSAAWFMGLGAFLGGCVEGVRVLESREY